MTKQSKDDATNPNQLSLDTKLEGIQLEDKFTLSRDKDSKADGKKLFATWDFSDLTIANILYKAKSQVRIAWQNGNRDNFDNFNDGEHLGVIKVLLAGGKMAVDSEKVVANRFAAGDFDARVAILMEVTGLEKTAARQIVQDQLETEAGYKPVK